jgi:hypothetical protein
MGGAIGSADWPLTLEGRVTTNAAVDVLSTAARRDTNAQLEVLPCRFAAGFVPWASRLARRAGQVTAAFQFRDRGYPVRAGQKKRLQPKLEPDDRA